jgi:hypothetical protein
MTEHIQNLSFEEFMKRLNNIDIIPKDDSDKYAFVLGHLGLGDMLWMNGAVRFIAKYYKKVAVVVKNHYLDAVKTFYKDLDNIIYFNVVGDPELMPFPIYREQLERLGIRVFSAGCHYYNTSIYDFPLSFYDNFGIPRDIRTKYFHVERMPEGKERYEFILKNSPSDGYIVFHQQSSSRTITVSDNFDKDKYLLLDLNKNLYPSDHKFYSIAECVINKPLPSHIELFENATEIHMIESSVYCLATHVDLSKVKRKVCYYPCDNSANRLGIFETGTI